MNVLSIDFDFFQNTTKEMLVKYPDGHDLPSMLTCVIWATHYVTCPSLRDITINEPLFTEIKEIIKNQDTTIPVLITNSHKHAYDFIKSMNKPVSLVNIDFHHDLINDNMDRVDCGNWIGHLKHEGIVNSFTWITRPTAVEMYGITDIKEKYPNVRYDFDTIRNKKFDAIFLCRSDTWLPPHLDPYFNELVELFGKFETPARLETAVAHPRDYEQYMTFENIIRDKIKNADI